MTHDDAFLIEVLKHPKEDAPRLIYSDWLDEQGHHDRAEFIRVQCTLSSHEKQARPLLQPLPGAVHLEGQRSFGRMNWESFYLTESYRPMEMTFHVRELPSAWLSPPLNTFHPPIGGLRTLPNVFIDIDVQTGPISPPVRFNHWLVLNCSWHLESHSYEIHARHVPQTMEELREDKHYETLRDKQQKLLENPRNYVNWTPAVLHTGSQVGIRHGIQNIVHLSGKGFTEAAFQRGFVERITSTANAFLEYSDTLLTATPLRGVNLTTWPGVFLVINDGSERVARIQRVQASYQPSSSEHVEDMARHLFHLEWPDIQFNFPTPSPLGGYGNLESHVPITNMEYTDFGREFIRSCLDRIITDDPAVIADPRMLIPPEIIDPRDLILPPETPMDDVPGGTT